MFCFFTFIFFFKFFCILDITFDGVCYILKHIVLVSIKKNAKYKVVSYNFSLVLLQCLLFALYLNNREFKLINHSM